MAVALAILLSAVPALAQTNRIGGIVRDETGGPIRGAIVRAEFGGGNSAPLSPYDRDRRTWTVHLRHQSLG